MLQDTSLSVSHVARHMPYVQDTALYHKLQGVLLCRFTKVVALDFDGGLDIRLETIKFRILYY